MNARRTARPDGADDLAVLRPPPTVVEIAARLEGAGFETWCVGGAVRDALLGLPHADWDLATAARPEQVKRLFRRTVPVGEEHGTIGVLDRDGTMHEVTTFRRDVRTDGRHADVEFGASLDEDLARRDFTINAIAYSPRQRVLRDPFEGRADLARGVVRAVGVPADRMREDRLRALRAMRFAARFDFTIDDATWRAIVASADSLTRLSAERVLGELTKTMEQISKPSRAILLWRDSGALGVLLPALRGLDASAVRTLDFLAAPALMRASSGGHTAQDPGRAEVQAVARAKGRRLLRLAGLFLEVPSAGVRRALKSLRFSNADADWIASLVDGWQAVGPEMERALLGEGEGSGGGASGLSDSVVRRWVAAVGRLEAAGVVRLAAARWCARRVAGEPAPNARDAGRLYRRVMTAAFHDAVEVGDLQVDGRDLIAAGIAPGPRIGELLRRLLAVVLDDPGQNTRERLIALAQRMNGGDGAAEPGGG